MLLTRQQHQRLDAWRKELQAQVFTGLYPLSFDGFETQERLSVRDACTHAMEPYPTGKKWGACWTYGWFATTFVVPEVSQDDSLVFRSGLGGEQLVYMQGYAMGSIDAHHLYVALPRDVQAGETLSLLIESYAGHGARLENLGPCPPERKAVPACPEAQCTVQQSEICVLHEDAYQLLMDVEVLYQLLETLPERSLRAMKVRDALMDFTYTADFELPWDARVQTFRQARAKLREALQCTNGSTAPHMMVFGQSHLDIAWLWPMEETYRKVSRTYANQLRLLSAFPEYRFLACEPVLLEMLKEQSPEIWASVQECVHTGQIFADGAFYVECDTNLPGGESLIRQLLLGLRWYQENLGIQSHTAWLPDCFGFSGQLPQILRGFHVPYFATQKLLRADPEYPAFPWQNFLWEGIDGSTVQAVSFYRNNAPLNPKQFHERWYVQRTQDDHIDTMLFPFGYGDGGGGPVRDFLEMARRMRNLEGIPTLAYATLEDYFQKSAESASSHRWVGELYLQWHRGVYTAQRRAKMLSRQLEIMLHDAEWLLSLIPDQDMYRPILQDIWKTLLTLQFHDVISGVSIQRVHAEQTQSLHEAMQRLQNLIPTLARSVWPETAPEGMTILNLLPWERDAWITLPGGEQVFQHLAPGTASPLDPKIPQPQDAMLTEVENGFRLQNRRLTACINLQGEVTALSLDGQDWMEQGMLMNAWKLYKQVESVYDAWEMSEEYPLGEIHHAMQSKVSVLKTGPACVALRVEHTFLHSTAVQIISLYAGETMLRFQNFISWHERHTMLKIAIHTALHPRDAIHEIQFGHIARPTHRSDAHERAQYEVCQQKYSALVDGGRGLAVINNGIYGLSTSCGALSLTILRSPLVPDDTCDLGDHEVAFAIEPFAGTLKDSSVVQHAYAFNHPPLLLPGTCASSSGFSAENAILETIKPAEDGEGCILRLYECYGSLAMAKLHLPYTMKLEKCTMGEEFLAAIGSGTDFTLSLKPFEILTLRAIPRPVT